LTEEKKYCTEKETCYLGKDHSGFPEFSETEKDFWETGGWRVEGGANQKSKLAVRFKGENGKFKVKIVVTKAKCSIKHRDFKRFSV